MPVPAAQNSSLRDALKGLGKCLCEGARLMIGLPDYETYAAHMRRTHPDREPVTYEAFFQERQAARFGEGTGTKGFRCC